MKRKIEIEIIMHELEKLPLMSNQQDFKNALEQGLKNIRIEKDKERQEKKRNKKKKPAKSPQNEQ
jgi:hypothetical protein